MVTRGYLVDAGDKAADTGPSSSGQGVEMRVGIIGGGSVGGRLAVLMQAAGHDVMVGVRDPGRGAAGRAYAAGSLAEAASHGEVVIIAVPYTAADAALAPLAGALAGKIVVDATNPLNEDWSPLPVETSAAEAVAALLPGSRVVKAFNTIFADAMTPERLDRSGQRITAFIAGDDGGANGVVAELARSAGFAPVVAGPLRNARHLEAMAHLNIAIALSGGGTNAAFLYDQRPA